jgi:hypothetical protein
MSNKCFNLRENLNIFGNDTSNQNCALKELRAHPVQEMPANTQSRTYSRLASYWKVYMLVFPSDLSQCRECSIRTLQHKYEGAEKNVCGRPLCGCGLHKMWRLFNINLQSAYVFSTLNAALLKGM